MCDRLDPLSACGNYLQECDELIAKGISGTGQGFDTLGRRVGGFSRQPPLSSLRESALAAAEKRARLGTLLPSGPRRLGGDSNIMAALSPIQAAAMAAERRMQDDLWCGSVSSGTSSAVENETGIPGVMTPRGSAAGSKDSIVVVSDTDVICLDDDGVCSSKVGSDSKDGSMSSSTSGSIRSHRATDSIEDKANWECNMCTLLNQPLVLICEACGTQKPKDVGTKFKIWSCKFCTLENSVKLDKCSACGQWRYSFGAPVSTRGPHLGT